jgi:serine/threonine-protein kinase
MADPLTPGTRFGEFEILDRAGEGGMGVVYRARQASLGRTVALKVISPSVVDAEDFRIRFGHESRLAASIDHPNVVSVYDAGEVDGQPYIAMQWVDGADLQTLLSRGPLEPGRAATIIVQIARALDAAHAKGLLHRDVKPGNVLVRQLPDGDHAYLTDFGLAKLQDSEAMTQLTKTGYYIGTTGYLSPEQIRGEDVTPVSDLYALGCVLHEALTGSQPFARTNDMAVAWAHANDPRPRPSELRPELGAGWDEVVAKAMAIEPGERYATGAAISERPEEILDRRLASGEIDAETYEALRTKLRAARAQRV